MEAGPGSDPAPRPVQAPPLPAWAARLRRKQAGSPRGRGPWTAGCSGRSASPASSALPPQARGSSPGQGRRRRPSPASPPGLRAQRAQCPWVGRRAARAALDPRLLLPRAVRAPLTQRNTLHTRSLASSTGPRLPRCAPGAASRAPLCDAAVTRTDTFAATVPPAGTPATWVTGRRTASARSVRAEGRGPEAAARGAGRLLPTGVASAASWAEARGCEEALSSGPCRPGGKRGVSRGRPAHVYRRPGGSRDLAPGTAGSPPRDFQTQRRGQIRVLAKPLKPARWTFMKAPGLGR